MRRNFQAPFRYVFLLAILSLFVLKATKGYKFDVPNYEVLKNQKILTSNYEFPHEISSLSEIKSQYQAGINNLLNANRQSKYVMLTFEIFMYPYRVYSYFDDANKKQYILKRIGYAQFRQFQEVQIKDQEKAKLFESKSLFQSEISVQECLIKSCQNLSIDSLETELKFTPLSECLSESALYSLIPDILIIVQGDHEQVELQKINEEYLLSKKYTGLEDASYYIELHLHRVNIHSYLYEARLTLMRYLLKKYSKQYPGNQESENSENSFKNTETIDKRQTNEGLDEKSSKKPLTIKIKDYFYNEQQIWAIIHDQNSAILSNLFNGEKYFYVQESTKYDYLATKATFYFAQINHDKCPISTHDLTFKMFADKDQNNNQIQSQPDMCTFLKIHKIYFIQAEIPEPIEYVSEKSLFYNVKSLSLGLVEKNFTKTSLRERDLLIHIQTDNSNIEITYGKAWKEIRAEDRPKNLPKNYEGNDPIAKVFFLSETKVELQNNTVTLWKQVQSVTTKYEKKCDFDVKPFAISVRKINNELFTFCAEGSQCTIIDKNCNKISEVALTNANGISWEYKMNYFEDKVLSYVSMSRRSDLVYVTAPAPIDQTLMQLISLPSGTFLQEMQFTEVEPGLYQINRTVINSKISYDENNKIFEICPTFSKGVLPYKYQPERLFSDSIYRSFSRFKLNYLDYILAGKLQEKFNKFYFPDFPKEKQSDSLKILNVMNNSEFNLFFSDCIFDSEKLMITFRKNWKGCKVVLKTSSLMLSESTIAHPDNSTSDSNSLDMDLENSETDGDSLQKNFEEAIENPSDTIFSNSGTGKNLLIVCSAPRSSPAYSKCRATVIDITQNFRDWSRNSKFFLEGGKYFQLYFFNMKFSTQSNENSFLEILQKLAREQFPFEDLKKNEQPNDTNSESQLKSYKIQYPKIKDATEVYITLIDYEKQELEGILKILLIAVCILFPAITICCCVVFFKSNFQNILIYYGVMNVQPSFRYPLNNLALKIKMRELTDNKYVKVYKNEKTPQVDTEIISKSDVKYSAECCFCLDELKVDEEIAELYCKHEFHSKCFIDWVKSEPNTKCPLCKRAFTKSALSQFNSRLNSTPSPTRPVQQFSEENESESNFSNEIEIEFES